MWHRSQVNAASEGTNLQKMPGFGKRNAAGVLQEFKYEIL